MTNYYVHKIIQYKKNPMTGDIWHVHDIPKLWREEIRQYLKDNYPDFRDWDND